MVKIALIGAAGKMGQAITKVIDAHPQATLVAAVVSPSSPYLGKAVGDEALHYSDDLEQACRMADVVIDFTVADVFTRHCDVYEQTKTKVVSGVTGFSPDQLKRLDKASSVSPMLVAPNMSIGVNLCFALAEQAAKVLSDYEVDILDVHHNQKIDAPSGTALALGQRVAKNGHHHLQQDVLARKSSPEQIGFSVLRTGNVFGEHTVRFTGPHDKIELVHEAQSRDGFAQGAVVAALWLANQQQPAMYAMSDVLSLSA